MTGYLEICKTCKADPYMERLPESKNWVARCSKCQKHGPVGSFEQAVKGWNETNE